MKILVKSEINPKIVLKSTHDDVSKDTLDWDADVYDSPAVAGLCSDSDTEHTIPNRTEAIYQGLKVLLIHHDANPDILCALERQMHSYLDDSIDETVWLKRAKYLLAYPLSKYLRNELPPTPDKVFSPSGPLREWMRQRLISFCRRNTHLWFSWFQAKRSALPASKDLIDKAYQDHLKTLTATDPCASDQSAIERIFSNQDFKKVLAEVKSSFFENLKHQRAISGRPASSSACFERNRRFEGQFGQLKQLCLIPSDGLGLELDRMKWYPTLYMKGQLRSSITVEFRVHSFGENWLDLVSRSKIDMQTLAVSPVDSLFECDPSFGRPIRCTIQAVIEPMKLRIISKGEALPYYRMNNFQKALHSALKRLSCFRLIGRPLSPCDIIDLAKKTTDEDVWFSIDYSAATDGLSAKYGQKILNHIIDGDIDNYLDYGDYVTAQKVLGEHELFYPNTLKDPISDEFLDLASRIRERDGIDEIDSCVCSGRVHGSRQLNGQLMGSILSFPILCLANLGVFLSVMRYRMKAWTFNEKLNHVLVNGDDMVYAGERYVWKDHVALASAVGLKMSVGKAYIHDTYLNINSTSIHYNLRKKCSLGLPSYDTPYEIPFLNTGLYFCQSKVMNSSDDEFKSLCVNINKILAGSLPGRQSTLLGRLLSYHKERLNDERECNILIPRDDGHGYKKRVHLRNIFLPLTSGGMGVDPPPNFRYRVTKTDRLVATNLIAEDTSLISYGLPCPGTLIEKLDTVKDVSWYKKTKLPHYAEVDSEQDDLEEVQERKNYWIRPNSRCWGRRSSTLPLYRYSAFFTHYKISSF